MKVKNSRPRSGISVHNVAQCSTILQGKALPILTTAVSCFGTKQVFCPADNIYGVVFYQWDSWES